MYFVIVISQSSSFWIHVVWEVRQSIFTKCYSIKPEENNGNLPIYFKYLLGPEWNCWTEKHKASPRSLGRPSRSHWDALFKATASHCLFSTCSHCGNAAKQSRPHCQVPGIHQPLHPPSTHNPLLFSARHWHQPGPELSHFSALNQQKTKPPPLPPHRNRKVSHPPSETLLSFTKMSKALYWSTGKEQDPNWIRVPQGTGNCPKLRKPFPKSPWFWVRFVTPAKHHVTATWLMHAAFRITQSIRSLRRISKAQKNSLQHPRHTKYIYTPLHLIQTSSLNFVSS